jgi:hypothetical protein
MSPPPARATALSDERVQLNAAGLVVLKLKTPWRDGTTHLLSPLDFMQCLAARVPRPRLHLIRFHGVLAPVEAARHHDAAPARCRRRGDGRRGRYTGR